MSCGTTSANCGHRLDCFGRTDSNHDLRAVFSWSYELLGGSAARLFRLLAIHPGPALGMTTAASLMAVEARSAAQQLLDRTEGRAAEAPADPVIGVRRRRARRSRRPGSSAR